MKVHEMSRNAYIIHNFETDEIFLQSYNSTVAVLDRESGIVTLGRHWDYSVTTLKHVYNFLEQYAPSISYNLCNSRTKKRSIERLIENNYIMYDVELV